MGLKKTTEKFVSELKEIFKNKPFSFDKVVYTGARDYVTVTCDLHGDWRAMATNLQQGKGCRGCRTDRVTNARRKDKEHFIQKSKKVHGDTYDYSDVIYINNTKNVAIKCKEHGVFFQQPIAHYSGSGCTKCIKRMVKTLLDVKQHLDPSLLSDWEFIGLEDTSDVLMTQSVTVLCNKHGETFNTNFASLSNRKSCCDLTKNVLISEAQISHFSVYIEQMRSVHGNKYQYLDDFDKVSQSQKLNILCKEHGVFVQDIYHHLHRKQGCPKCAVIKQGKIKTDTWIESLEDLVLKIPLGDEINVVSFDKVKNSRGKLVLSCSKHGIFEKSVGNLKLGQRCPECSLYEGWGKSAYIQRSKDLYDGLCNLYLIRCWNDNEDFYKIGITVHKDIRRRFTKKEMPYKYAIVDTVCGDVEYIVNVETEAHKEMKGFHYTPKIPFGGHVRECFSKEGIEQATTMFKNLQEI